LGQGGFASEGIYVTYLDRNAADIDLRTVFAHEVVHVLDRQFADKRLPVMSEGLAVYAAGGHYWPEDLDARAAALLALGRYVPLADLARDFFSYQHEISYLEGGALIQYLVDTYGWEQFKTFYGSFQTSEAGNQELDRALQEHYGQGLAETEAAWLDHLRAQAPLPGQVDDLRLTLEHFDVMREYQQRRDPSAYFLTAWLPDGRQARERGITADFLRGPASPDDVALEALLASAGRARRAGDYAAAERLLAAVRAALAAEDLGADPVASDYEQIVKTLALQGYTAQAITVTGNMATAIAIRDWPGPKTLTLRRGASGWQLVTQGIEPLRSARYSLAGGGAFFRPSIEASMPAGAPGCLWP
jgi:hypothetical protein